MLYVQSNRRRRCTHAEITHVHSESAVRVGVEGEEVYPQRHAARPAHPDPQDECVLEKSHLEVVGVGQEEVPKSCCFGFHFQLIKDGWMGIPPVSRSCERRKLVIVNRLSRVYMIVHELVQPCMERSQAVGKGERGQIPDNGGHAG